MAHQLIHIQHRQQAAEVGGRELGRAVAVAVAGGEGGGEGAVGGGREYSLLRSGWSG